MSTLSLAVIAVCLLSVVNEAHARDYIVEALIFRQPELPPVEPSSEAPDAASASSPHRDIYVFDDSDEELWDNDRYLNDTSASRNTDASSDDIPRAEFFEPVLLTNAAAAIDRRPGFSVLAHAAWRQVGAARKESPVVTLPLRNSSAELTGSIRIYTKSFIFAEFNLSVEGAPVMSRRQVARPIVSRPTGDSGDLSATTLLGDIVVDNATTDSSPTPEGAPVFSNVPYRLKERRRVKFKEIHYFDHPRLGVILTVQPAEVEG